MKYYKGKFEASVGIQTVFFSDTDNHTFLENTRAIDKLFVLGDYVQIGCVKQANNNHWLFLTLDDEFFGEPEYKLFDIEEITYKTFDDALKVAHTNVDAERTNDLNKDEDDDEEFDVPIKIHPITNLYIAPSSNNEAIEYPKEAIKVEAPNFFKKMLRFFSK